MINYLQLREQLNETVDIVSLLEFYGAENIKAFNNEVRSKCILHEGKNNSSFRFNYNTLRWTCFSNNCGDGYRRDIYNLVFLVDQKLTGQKPDPKRVLNILMNFSGVKVDLENIDFSYDKETIDKLKNKTWAKYEVQTVNKLTTMSEKSLENFKDKIPMYFYQRGFSASTAKAFEVGFSPLGLNEPDRILEIDFPGRIVVPIRNHNNVLVGMSGRLATDDDSLKDKYGKYRHTYNLDRRHILYNLNLAKKYIQKTGYAILVEGFFDVMSLWQMGVRNVVATLGTKVNIEQLFLLLPYCNEIYLMFDGDDGGRESLSKTYKQACRYFNTYYVPLPDGIDPGDLTLKDFLKFLSRADK